MSLVDVELDHFVGVPIAVLVTCTDTVTVSLAVTAARSTLRFAVLETAVAEAVPEGEERGAGLVPVAPRLVVGLVRAGVCSTPWAPARRCAAT